jgi:HTH-type transcriptional regulator/antitoxin HigA
MITNDRQHKITKLQIENLKESLEVFNLNHQDSNVHPLLLDAEKAAIQSELDVLVNQVREYDDLKAGKIIMAEINSLADLPIALIKSRIANGLTQLDLANKVGIKMQQIQRYEAERYESASLKTLVKIAEGLGLSLHADIQLKAAAESAVYDVSNYPFKQMFQRGWFGSFSGTLNDAMLQSNALLAGLYQNAGMSNFKSALTKKAIRSGSTLNEFALDAWYARIVSKARNQEITAAFDKSNLNEAWLLELRQLSRLENGPLLAAEFLTASGIHFIVEQALEGTFLDGAALLLDNGRPVVAMTLRHDRLDNFWFVLFHEIFHIILHLTPALNAIFDDLDHAEDGIEAEADNNALNALIPDIIWKRSLVRFNPTSQGIINQAESLNINPALVAGRLRKEKNAYFLFNELIGQGQVRKYFLTQSNF